MDYNEACHLLRVTPTLLKWVTRHTAIPGGWKLRESSPGEFQESDLRAFDKHLRDPWPSRSVPTGIYQELLVEACGRCALCSDPCDKLQMAHIERMNVEVAYYFQHPGNLVGLCGTCHDRYDDQNLTTVSLEVVRAAKERLVSRKMEAIDRDVERARAVRGAVEQVKAELSVSLAKLTGSVGSPHSLWLSNPVKLIDAVTRGLYGQPSLAPGVAPTSAEKSLQALSNSVTNEPVTHAVVGGYIAEATGSLTAAPSEWDLLDADDDRTVCDVCDPGEDRMPPMVNYSHQEGDAFDVGTCEWCNSTSVRCRRCGAVRGVWGGEHEKALECEGGCGFRFRVTDDYDPRDGGGGISVEALPDFDEDTETEGGGEAD